jgi:hypothetical protein
VFQEFQISDLRIVPVVKKVGPKLNSEMDTVLNKNFEFKLIHSLNFRCMSCLKAYTTEDGVKKHLRKSHDIQTPSAIHYNSFVGEKRAKVPINQTEVLQPPVSQETDRESKQSSLSIAGVSYNCSMCDKVFKSYDGLKGHLASFHDFTKAYDSRNVQL